MPDRRRLNVLISAFACSPSVGSEPGLGWEAVRALSGIHDLTVVTRSRFRESIEGEIAKAGLPLASVQFRFLDTKWLPERFLEKSFIGENLVYWAWQARLSQWVRENRVGFDVAHHVTFVRYWMTPGVALHENLPYVFGPVGGADSAPPVLAHTMSWKGRMAHALRTSVRRVFSQSHGLTRAIAEASVCFATSRETANELIRLGAKDVRLGSDVNARSEAVISLRSSAPQGLPLIVCAGRLIEWKAYHLAIRAWALSGLRGRMEIYGSGPSMNRLKSLATELGVDDSVIIQGSVKRELLMERISEARLLLHPSLHDSGGSVIIEALQNGVPVVCWNHAGPGKLVDATCGAAVAIDKDSAEVSIQSMAQAIKQLATDDEHWLAMANGAIARVRENFTTEIHARRISDSYFTALEGHAAKPAGAQDREKYTRTGAA